MLKTNNYLVVLLLVLIDLQSESYARDQKPLVIAHRGASGYLPEHTLAAHALAHGLGADYLEPDLVMTKDSHIILLHDLYLEQTTDVENRFPMRKRSDGHWYAIDFTLKEIKSLRVHERSEQKSHQAFFPKRFPKEDDIFSIPTFIEFLQLVSGLNKSRGTKTGIYPELKHPEFLGHRQRKFISEFLRILKEYGYHKPGEAIFVQSFHQETLKAIRHQYRSNLPLIQLTYTHDPLIKSEKSIEKISHYANGIGAPITELVQKNKMGQIVPTQLVRWAHKNQLKIHAYTARSDKLPSLTANFFELHQGLFRVAQIDGIFSDFCDQSKRIITQLF